MLMLASEFSPVSLGLNQELWIWHANGTGESIAQLATYLRYVHAISYQRFQEVFADLRGFDISHGGLAYMICRVQHRLEGTVEGTTEQVRSSLVVTSIEAGARVYGGKTWEWLFSGADAVLHLIEGAGPITSRRGRRDRACSPAR